MGYTPHFVVPDQLVAENIFLTIGDKNILKGVNIRTEKGYITGLLGRNGGGKTTMLQSMFGSIKPEECDVFLNGVKIKKPFTKQGLVNYLPQNPFLPKGVPMRKILSHFSVAESEILEAFPELEKDLDRKTGELSGGRDRLFSVLSLLLAPTRFTLLDEPFSHIMPLHVERLKLLLVKLKEKKGIIITDHMYQHVLDVCNRLFLMKDGKTIFIRDMDDLVLHGYLAKGGNN